MMRAEADVVVVGSGAAGMTAALAAHNRGLTVVMVESQDHYGGATAVSGGIVWVPGNHILEREGSSDSRELGEAYFEAVVGGTITPQRRTAYLDNGIRMLSELENSSRWMRFHWVPDYTDYYPEAPGGLVEGRSIEPEILDSEELGEDLGRMVPPSGTLGMKGLIFTPKDFHYLNVATRTWRGKAAVFQVLYRTLKGKISPPKMTSGRALVGRLRLAMRDAGVPLYLSTPMTGLLSEPTPEGGERVTGVKVRHEGVDTQIIARRGVVLAAGGFGRSQAMRDQYHPAPSKAEWTMTPEGQNGDGIRAGIEVGAALDMMDKIWGNPSTMVPANDGSGTLRGQFLHIDRLSPSTLVVNGEGKRYFNESAPYSDFADAMYAEHAKGGQAIPSWMIFDQRGKRRYALLRTLPFDDFPKSWTEGGYVKVASTVEELAESIGVPAKQLVQTLRRYSTFAKSGVDRDFGKGTSAYSHYSGDPTLKNPNLAPIDRPPFYAVAVYPGDVGTKGGLKIDERSRVLASGGEPIPGLYAAGNNSGSVMGDSYPAGGASIGAAMVTAYSAVLDIADDHTD